MQRSSPLQQHCQHCLDGGGAFTLTGLSRQVVAANQSGMKKSAIMALLHDILQRLEHAKRDAECELVTELVQRIVDFSPGAIAPDEAPDAAGPSGRGHP